MALDPAGRAAARLARRRGAARGALWWERLWPALWPALGVVGAAACAALLDLPQFLPPVLHAALLGALALAVVVLLWRGLRTLRAPTPAEADRRLERASGLSHRPLAALVDRPATVDPAALGLWHAHVARAAARIGRLRVGPPRPGLAARDPRALRGALAVGLFACLVVAGPDALFRLGRGLRPGVAPGAAAPATEVQGWITPPAYTGLPPLILHAGGGPVSAPVGSRLTLSVTGGSGEPQLALDGAAEPFRALDAGSWQAERELAAGGRLLVRRGGGTLAAWDLTVVPDHPPVVSWTEPPGRGGNGRRLLTRLPWTVSDDYGVTTLAAELRLQGRPDAPPLVVAVPLGGNPRQAKGVQQPDLTAHPWAGLPVVARLVAHDAPGGTGTSADAAFTLPERSFEHPVAQGLIAARKGLSLAPGERASAAAVLDALSADPDRFDNDAGVLLNLRAIAALLRRERADGSVEEAQKRMWDLALQLEEGGTERTARAVANAREKLREAIEQAERREHGDPARPPDPARPDAPKRGEADKGAKPGQPRADAQRRPDRQGQRRDGAQQQQQQQQQPDQPPRTPEQAEIERRSRELQQAIRRHLQALAEKARREGTDLPWDPNAEHVTPRELDRLAQEMRDAAQQGDMDKAREKMAELEQMLEDLQNAKPQPRGTRRAEQRQRGRRQMSVVQDMVRREGGLLDHAGARPADAAAAQRDDDRRVQRALRRALGEMMQQQADLTGKIPDPLNEADQGMREADAALAAALDPAAAAAERRVIEALQRGGREMGQQMARQFGLPPSGGSGDENGDEQAGEGDQPGDEMAGDGQGGGPGDQAGNGAEEGNGADRDRADANGGRGDAQGERDPLGRSAGRSGNGRSSDGEDTRVPDRMEQARTRAIQDELRRREAERTRPTRELDYIDRLLKPF